MDWAALIRATLRLYATAALETWQRIQRAWWVVLLPFVYLLILLVTSVFAAPLGLVGGFILGFVVAMCSGSYLYFIAEVVQGNRVQPRELLDSWRPYWGSVISILFFVFILRTLLGILVVPGQSSQTVLSIINLVLLIILNPIPEIIYQGRSTGFAMLQESLDFLWDNGVEWFVPLVGLALVSAVVLPVSILAAPLEIGRLSFPTLFGSLLSGSPAALLVAALNAGLLYVLMVFRGRLFRKLADSSRRQRIYRARFD
ncbi:MAG: hypothetical protein J4F42_03775 [Desulfurellaceae bacterium]|nr:hypothetical protein [Desulfurellaceae bacterium]